MSAVSHVHEVGEMAARAVVSCGGGSEGFGYAVNWTPGTDRAGNNVVVWLFMVTLRSPLLGAPPLAVTTDPLPCSSVPSQQQVTAIVADCLPKLRSAHRELKHEVISAAPAGRLN